MAERSAEAPVPAEKRIEFRIGINPGEIIRDGRDSYDGGVNRAARKLVRHCAKSASLALA